MKKLISPLMAACTLFLIGCSAETSAPTINFIGIATGSLTTNLQSLYFDSLFSPDDHDLVGVVSFDEIPEGSTVMATWFSPDERSMPLGRTSIVTQSGAKIARFSFGSAKDWQKAPYQLRIDASTPDDEPKSASGSVSFFIGMNEQEIAAYADDWQKWQAAEAKQRAEWDAIQQAEKVLTESVQKSIGGDTVLTIELRHDINGDGAQDIVFLEATDELQPVPQASVQGAIATVTCATRCAITTESGDVLLKVVHAGRMRSLMTADAPLVELPKEGDILFAALPSGRIVLSWTDGDKQCSVELPVKSDGQYEKGDIRCL